MSSPSPAASFVIPTRNRKDCLLQCVASAFAQTVPVEVRVYDDGSTDGTEEALRAAFPAEKYPNLFYTRLAGGNGPCVLRNHGTLVARSEFVFPVDDDSILSSPDIVESVIREFDHPRVGVVAIPMINILKSTEELQRTPDASKVCAIAEYIGAAHALRRTPFLASGGYREVIFQYGEEGDACIRLLNNGYIVRPGNSAPIHHHESTSRNFARWHRLGPRNNIYITWCNVPLSRLPIHLAATTVNSLRHGLRVSALRHASLGLLNGYGLTLAHLSDRSAVSVQTYQLFRKLRTTRGIPLDQLEGALPPLRSFSLIPIPENPPPVQARQFNP